MTTTATADASAAGIPSAITPASEAGVVATPSDTVKAAVMKATPEVFKFERLTSGVSAVLYEAVRQWGLYKIEGFDSMTAYAEAKLGVIGKANNAAYARAGKAVWDNYPALAQSALDSLVGPRGFTRVNLALMPSVPGVGLLRELPAAIKRTKPAERAALLERVSSGEISHSDLRQQGRKKPKNNSKPSSAAASTTVTTTIEEDVPEGFTRPDIFNDVGDLDHAASALREATSTLDSLYAGWSEQPGSDVRPVLPTLKAIVAGLNSATTKLVEITPRSICRACRGEAEHCKVCRNMGWLPQKTSPHAPRHKARAPKPSVIKAKSKETSVRERAARGRAVNGSKGR